jgi:hypothetical protein
MAAAKDEVPTTTLEYIIIVAKVGFVFCVVNSLLPHNELFPHRVQWMICLDYYLAEHLPDVQLFLFFSNLCFSQFLVAISPLLALAFVLFSGFEDPNAEALKRRKKGDFELEGHGE